MERSAPFRDVPETSWRDWRWQHRNALRTAEALAGVVALTPAERRGLAVTAGAFRVAVTPYYASLIDPEHPFCPVRMQAIPVAAEAMRAEGDLRDPGRGPHPAGPGGGPPLPRPGAPPRRRLLRRLLPPLHAAANHGR